MGLRIVSVMPNSCTMCCKATGVLDQHGAHAVAFGAVEQRGKPGAVLETEPTAQPTARNQLAKIRLASNAAFPLNQKVTVSRPLW